MWKLSKRYISANTSPGISRPEYIVIHDTGNRSPSANARAHQQYFCDPTAQVSYHYVCDSGGVIECVPRGRVSHHCGIGKNRLNEQGKISLVTNYNSISIAYCVCQGEDIDKTLENTAMACAIAGLEYDISVENIVRHSDIAQEKCPAAFYGTQGWQDFARFKLRVAALMDSIESGMETASRLQRQGMVADKSYWSRGLNGTGELDLKWLCILLNKLMDK